MVKPEGQDPGDARLVFAAHNNHDPRCGRYYGCFENLYGEQFVFTFDRATGTGTVSGGDLGLLDEALRNTRDLAAQVQGDAASGLPVSDAVLALGRVTGLTGKDEVSWLRACLMACTLLEGRPGGHRSSEDGPRHNLERVAGHRVAHRPEDRPGRAPVGPSATRDADFSAPSGPGIAPARG
jgi:hypothetical protein